MVLLFLRLPQKHGSATLGLHARAPGCWRSVKRLQRWECREGFRPITESGPSDAVRAKAAPGARELPRERRGSARSTGSASAGASRVPGFALGNLSTVDPEGDCRAPVPLAFQRSPPFPLRGRCGPVERGGPFGDLGRSDASGAFGVPPGPSGSWRHSSGSAGTSGLPRGLSGPRGGLEGTWEIFGFPRTRPVAFAPDLRVQGGSFAGALETVVVAKPAFPPWLRVPLEPKARPAGPTGKGLQFCGGLPSGCATKGCRLSPPPVSTSPGPMSVERWT
jgi:hypothetical protein